MAAPSFARTINPADYLINDPNGAYYGGYTPEGNYVSQNANGYLMMSPYEDGGPEGNQYGQYFQQYDTEGNAVGDAGWAKGERSNGFIGDNLDIFGPLLVGGFAGWGAGLAGGMMGGGVNVADMSLAEVLANAGIDVASIGIPEAAAATIVPSDIAGGIIKAVTDAIPGGAGSVVSVLKAIGAAIPGLGSVFNGIADAVARNPMTTLGGALSVVGGLKSIDDFKDIVDTGVRDIRDSGANRAADILAAAGRNESRLADRGDTFRIRYSDQGRNNQQTYNNLGNQFQQQWNNMGQRTFDNMTALGQRGADRFAAVGQTGGDRLRQVGNRLNAEYSGLGGELQGMFTGLGTKYQGQYNTLANEGYGQFSNLAGQMESKYGALSDKVKESIGEFKPYSLTSNVGSTDEGGNFKLNAPMQGVNDIATSVANKSFSAADAFDMDKIREQEFGLMKRLWAPDDEKERLANESRQIAQGRAGLQSFSDANSYTITDPDTGATYRIGANPYDVAMEKAIQNRDLQGFLTADDNAIKRRGAYIDQGRGAMEVPLAFANYGLNLTKTGADLGKTAFDARVTSADRWAPYAAQGIDAYGNAMTSGINSYLGDRRSGITTAADFDTRGVDAYGDSRVRGLGALDRGLFGGAEFQNTQDVAGTNFQNTQDTAGTTGMLADERTGVTARTGAERAGADAAVNAENEGLDRQTNLQTEGARGYNQGELDAIEAKYDALDTSIKTRMGGEERALNAVIRLYEAMARALGTMDNRTGAPATPKEGLQDIVRLITNNSGMTEDQATEYIRAITESTNWDPELTAEEITALLLGVDDGGLGMFGR